MFQKILAFFTDEDDYSDQKEEISIAYREWQEAQSYFDSVTDPDLTELAIFQLEAARRKYFYMLGAQRREEELYLEESKNKHVRM